MKGKKIISYIVCVVLTLSLIELNTNVKTANAYSNETSNVELGKWSFTQSGLERSNGSSGYINSVHVGYETLSNWERWIEYEQTQTASRVSNRFEIDIADTGYWAQWEKNPRRIEPNAVVASTIVEAKKAHKYTVSFKAKASSKKYAYIRFGTEVEGILPYGQKQIKFDDDAKNQAIEIGTTEKTFTFSFSNEVGAKNIKTDIMLGAFLGDDSSKVYDMDGNDISDIVTESEARWNGVVEISDFTITDNGSDYDIETKPIETTKAPTPPNNNNNTPNIAPVKRVKYIRPKKGMTYLKVGETSYAEFERVGFRGGKTEYFVKNENIATVNSKGKITAKNTGKTTIYIWCTYQGYTYGTYCYVKVSGYELNYNDLGLYKNQSFKLKVNGYKGKAKWKSSNNKIATVRNGKVVAKKKGKATITCIIKGKKIKCKVKVYNPRLLYKRLTMLEGQKCTNSIKANSKKQKWWVKNPSIAKVNKKGVVTGKKAGDTILYCKVDGVTAKCKIYVWKNQIHFNGKYNKLLDVPYGKVIAQPTRVYFAGNKLKVDVRIFNKTSSTIKKIPYMREELQVTSVSNPNKVYNIKKEFYNTKVNIKSFSVKNVTLTLSTKKSYKSKLKLVFDRVQIAWRISMN